MTFWWAYAQFKKRNDVADVAWGLGFVAITGALLIRSDRFDAKSLIASAMVTIWGVRLAAHIATRHQGKPEDGRYQAMRENWKFPALQSYVSVFLTQGFFMILVALPILLLMFSETRELQWYNFVGLAVWAVAFLFEAVGDYQLAQFIKNPSNKGKIMKYGLWSYTRHPNYFGEITSWWGFYLFTLFTPYWYVGVLGPLTITVLILGVSGIPMLEKRYKGNAEYEAYQKTTSAFFPLPPR